MTNEHLSFFKPISIASIMRGGQFEERRFKMKNANAEMLAMNFSELTEAPGDTTTSRTVGTILDKICELAAHEEDSGAVIWDALEFVARQYGEAKRYEWHHHLNP